QHTHTSHGYELGGPRLMIGSGVLAHAPAPRSEAFGFDGWRWRLSGLGYRSRGLWRRWRGPWLRWLRYGVFSLAGGVFCWVSTLSGELAVTVTLGAVFMIQGAFEIGLAFELRPAPNWGWMLISGLASIVLSLAIVAGLPGTSLITLGILIGINFVSSGLAYLL